MIRRHWVLNKMAGVFITFLVLLPVAGQARPIPMGVQLADVQTLVRSNGSDPTSLDPMMSETQETHHVIADLFSGLVTQQSSGEIVAELAESWSQVNNQVWNFQLRPGITWSNGQPIRASDFVFSWRRLGERQSLSPYQSYLSWAHINNAEAVAAGRLPVTALGIKALDDRHLQVTLSQPVVDFLSIIAHSTLSPVSQAVVEKYGDTWTQLDHIVVSGPYKPVKWVINEKLVATRNANYWDNRNTRINQVTYLPISEPNAVLNRYLADQSDIADTIPTVDFPRIKKMIPSQIRQTPLLGLYYYRFNLNKPPFNDVRIRQALSLAVDRMIITQRVLGMGQQPAYSLLPRVMGNVRFTDPDYAHWTQQQRDDKAKQLLAEAGFTAANPLKLNLLYNTSQDHQRIAIALAAFWKKTLGVQVTLQNQEWKSLLATMHSGNFQLARYTWVADYNDPDSFLVTFNTKSTQNQSFYSNPTYDKLVQQASSSQNVELSQQRYQQASDILTEDMPSIPIYYFVQNLLVKPWVGGLSVTSTGEYLTKNMYIIKH